MSKEDTLKTLDLHFSLQLGCRPEDLTRPGLTSVHYNRELASDERIVPKPLWIFLRNRSCIISAEPWAAGLIEPIITSGPFDTLSQASLQQVKQAVESQVNIWFWFLGYQMYCSPEMFKPRFDPKCRRVTLEDPGVQDLADRHCLAFNGVSIENGDVFGLFDGPDLVSYSWIKPRTKFAAAIGVVTAEGYRKRGLGSAVVSAAAQEILDRRKIPIYDLDQDNTASLNLARSLGFELYAEDFGCVKRASG